MMDEKTVEHHQQVDHQYMISVLLENRGGRMRIPDTVRPSAPVIIGDVWGWEELTLALDLLSERYGEISVLPFCDHNIE